MRRQATHMTPDRSNRSGVMSFPLAFTMPDQRADKGVRHVSIAGGVVKIERSIAGIVMRLDIPVSAYRGVALSLHAAAGHPDYRFTLSLKHEDPDLDIRLFEAINDEDVTDEWRFWAERFDMKLLIVADDGSVTEPCGYHGAAHGRTPAPRRIPAHLLKRRPRFLTRRRAAKLADCAPVHREREIIARD